MFHVEHKNACHLTQPVTQKFVVRDNVPRETFDIWRLRAREVSKGEMIPELCVATPLHVPRGTCSHNDAH